MPTVAQRLAPATKVKKSERAAVDMLLGEIARSVQLNAMMDPVARQSALAAALIPPYSSDIIEPAVGNAPSSVAPPMNASSFSSQPPVTLQQAPQQTPVPTVTLPQSPQQTPVPPLSDFLANMSPLRLVAPPSPPEAPQLVQPQEPSNLAKALSIAAALAAPQYGVPILAAPYIAEQQRAQQENQLRMAQFEMQTRQYAAQLQQVGLLNENEVKRYEADHANAMEAYNALVNAAMRKDQFEMEKYKTELQAALEQMRINLMREQTAAQLKSDEKRLMASLLTNEVFLQMIANAPEEARAQLVGTFGPAIDDIAKMLPGSYLANKWALENQLLEVTLYGKRVDVARDVAAAQFLPQMMQSQINENISKAWYYVGQIELGREELKLKRQMMSQAARGSTVDARKLIEMETKELGKLGVEALRDIRDIQNNQLTMSALGQYPDVENLINVVSEVSTLMAGSPTSFMANRELAADALSKLSSARQAVTALVPTLQLSVDMRSKLNIVVALAKAIETRLSSYAGTQTFGGAYGGGKVTGKKAPSGGKVQGVPTSPYPGVTARIKKGR